VPPKRQVNYSGDEDAYAGEAEATMFIKETKYEIKYEDISDEGDQKHSDEKCANFDILCNKLHAKMRFH
jgi:hypothetical protein